MPQDSEPIETAEWLASLESVIETDGPERAEYLIQRLIECAQSNGCELPQAFNSPYKNTIDVADEPDFPDTLAVEHEIRQAIRWNAMMMVVRANQFDGSLGGHIGTYASAALLYETGFNHFWRAPSKDNPGDLIYFQGHASPGIYARSYLEGHLTEKQLDHFRRESTGVGISSYPHPWLMPNYWSFPTVSMGLGPLQAIYQARFLKYLQARDLEQQSDRKVWCFCGDGEMDEPESMGALSIAAREGLDNLIFVVNCNLQRLDGPVRGNGKIIQELERMFVGANWQVIKVIWGSGWDKVLAQDDHAQLQERMEELIDGDYQLLQSKGGAYFREKFFEPFPELSSHVPDLMYGGHDPKKIYAAYHKAVKVQGKPVVILTKTVKGYGLGKAGEAQNVAHNVKKMTLEQLKHVRDHLGMPIEDQQLEALPFYKFKPKSQEALWLKQSRERLGGYLPKRIGKITKQGLQVPALSLFSQQLEGSGERSISTTMAFVRILAQLCRDKNLGKHIVPIIPDEARTFGMEGLFRQMGIYSPSGQQYEPVDSEQVMFYREAKNGQILEEGINEAGAFCSWLAAATSYSNHQTAMIPFYIFYSMFGFQRIGDLCWAAGDARARGFLLGATFGKTTLNGEGLQHQDGHSHLMANTIANCVSYNPAFSYELAVIIQHGLKRMIEQQEDVFYYITLTNENYLHPPIQTLHAEQKSTEEKIIQGMYCLTQAEKQSTSLVALLGSGSLLKETQKAAELLLEDFDISSDVWSVTSFNELANQAHTIERINRLNPDQSPKTSYVSECFSDENQLIVAVSDLVVEYAEQIRPFVAGRYITLGPNGYGRSDTRENLRKHFEIDKHYIVLNVLHGLWKKDQIQLSLLKHAMVLYECDTEKPNPRWA